MRFLRPLPPRAAFLIAALCLVVPAESKEITFQPPGRDQSDRVKEAQRKFDQARKRVKELSQAAGRLWAKVDAALLEAHYALEPGETLSEEQIRAILKEAGRSQDQIDEGYENYRAFLAAAAATDEAREELARLGNEAIALADEVYRITQPDGLDGEPTYAGFPARISVGLDWTVRLGASALLSPDGTLSPAWLAANKIIALTRVQQSWDGRRHVNTPRGASDEWKQQESAINGIEAYDAALKHGETLGLSETEIEHLRGVRERWIGWLTDKNKERVAAGDYTTEPKDTDPEQQTEPDPAPTLKIEFERYYFPIPPVHVPSEPLPNKPPGKETEEKGDVEFQFSGNGSTFGVDLHIKNKSSEVRIVDVRPGTFLHGELDTTQVMVTTPYPLIFLPPKSEGHVRVPAPCTQRDKKPPKDGELLTPGIVPAFVPGIDGNYVPNRDFDVTKAFTEPTEEMKKHQPLGAGALIEVFHTGTAIESRMVRRVNFFERPTEDPPGPFEQANPPAGADAAQTDPDDAMSLPNLLRELLKSPPPPREPRFITVLGTESDPLVDRIVVVPGSRAGKLDEPRPTYNDTLRVQTMWAVTENDGEPDREHIASEAKKQFLAQGVSDEAASRAAEQVAKEVGDEAEEILEEARDLAKEPQISFRINATLKGLPDDK